MARLRLSQLNLWQKHASAVMDILQRAADLMIANGEHGLEPEMNRKLFLYFYQAMRDRRGQGLFVPGGLPVWEARNQPTSATSGASSEKKIPDIQWGYQDDQVEDVMRSARIYHIECKRIGTTVLNGEYVKSGIRRFVDEVWSYGKDVDDGAMVGYVEGSGPESTLIGINGKAASGGLPPILEVSARDCRHDLHHEFERDFQKSPFRLHHVWLDVRAPKVLPVPRHAAKRKVARTKADAAPGEES